MRRTIAQAVAEQSQRHGIRPGILLSVILAESSFRTDAVSSKGAVGLMQILPSTAQFIAAEMDLAWEDDATLTDPQLNIALGSAYLRRLLEVYHGDLHLALAAYNMGPGNLQALLETSPEASARFSSSYSRSIVAKL
jgi:soluble lytic murein transglycosylase